MKVIKDVVDALDEASACLDALIAERPMLAAKRAGCTTVGNTAAACRSALAKVKATVHEIDPEKV